MIPIVAQLPAAAETTVLIPAAGRVPEGVLSLSNITCPAMVPVAGRPIIHWTMRYLHSLGFRKFVIAVARRGMFVEDFVECSFGADCEIGFLVPSAEGGVGRTVFELSERAETPHAMVVLGDTHFRFADPDQVLSTEPAVLTHPVDDSYRWCVADVTASGHVKELHDKRADLTGVHEALIGVYYFPSVNKLRLAARTAVAAAEAADRRTEFADILRRIAVENPIRVLPAGDWLDVGNPDRQASTHRTLLQKREFNELTIDETFGAVTKRSRHVEKFLDEINYLRLLPPDLAVLFPRVLSYSTDWDAPSVTLEYYGYPTLAEVFVFENVDPSVWEQVFKHLRDIVVRGFMSRTRPLPAGAVHEMYLGKTQRRLKTMQCLPELKRVIDHQGPIRVNGVERQNLNELWPKLETAVAQLEANVRGAVIHGDFCLSNILYDLRSRICKLLDPRGSFGTTGIYGDPRYDIAKLYHSVFAKYDFIVNDLFHAKIDGLDIELNIRSRPGHAAILERFERVFFQDFERREILLLTGLLFASMPALHYDAPQRQIAMYAQAISILGDALDECGPS